MLSSVTLHLKEEKEKEKQEEEEKKEVEKDEEHSAFIRSCHNLGSCFLHHSMITATSC